MPPRRPHRRRATAAAASGGCSPPCHSRRAARCCSPGAGRAEPPRKQGMVARVLDEDDLIAQARGGDAAAYASLVRRHQDVAFRTAMLITGNAQDAEDAAQDGFVKAWRALGRFRAGAPFRPWLLQIVANEARNRRRSAGRRVQLGLRAAAEEPSGGAAPSPEAGPLSRGPRPRLVG